MDIWEKKFNIKKPESCNRTAICCRFATAISPWKKLAVAYKNPASRDFFNIFIPYPDQSYIKEHYPDIYNTCLEVLKERKDINIADVYFYHCRFIDETNFCQIYEDRPVLCRDFPESPLDAIPERCGFYRWAVSCRRELNKLQRNLEALRIQQYSTALFFISSPLKSWLK